MAARSTELLPSRTLKAPPSTVTASIVGGIRKFGIGVAVSVSIGRKVVGIQISCQSERTGRSARRGRRRRRAQNTAGALIPPDAVSMGSPGIEIGAPGRPGLASSTWSWMMMLCAGSGVSKDGAEATTVIACDTEAS